MLRNIYYMDSVIRQDIKFNKDLTFFIADLKNQPSFWIMLRNTINDQIW